MAPQSVIVGPELRASRKRARALLSVCLAEAIAESAPSHAAAARWMGIDAATVRRYLRGKVAINVEVVLSSARVGGAFRRALCTHDHAEHAAPYLARRRVARRKSARKGAR